MQQLVRQDDKRAAQMRGRQEAMQQPAGATTRRQEGGAMRGRQEAMQQPAGMTRDTRAARQEATQPRSLSGPNGIDWRGGSHGLARVER